MSGTREDITVTGTDKTREMVNSVNRGLNSISSTAKTIASHMGLMSAVSVAGLGHIVLRAAEAGEKIQKLSLQYKASTEFLSRMNEVAKLSDSSLESVAKAIQYTQKSAAAAYDGTAKYADAYKALHINIQEFVRMTPEQQFLALTEGFNSIDNASRRTSLGMTIMGRSGTEMFRIMAGGTEKIKEVWQEADKMGLTLSQLQANQLAEFAETIKRLTGYMQGFTIQAVAPSADFLVYWADRLGIVSKSLLAMPMEEVQVRLDDLNTRYDAINDNLRALSQNSLDAGQAAVAAGTEGASLIAARSDNEFEIQALMKKRGKILDEINALLERQIQLQADSKKKPPADDGLGESSKAASSRRKEQIYDMEQWLAGYKREIALEKTYSENNELLTGILDKRNEANAGVIRGLQEEKQKLSMTSEELAVYEAVSRLSTDATEEQKVAVGELAREIQGQKDAMEATAEESKQAYKEMSEFAKQAAHNMENSMSEFFFNIMDGKLDDLAGNFAKTLQRMAADMAASEVMHALTGDYGTTGKMGGLVSKGMSWLGAIIPALFGGVPGGGGGGGSAYPYATLAMGGVMTSAGPMPLQRYAGGGVARSPQVALFGEGSRPEAYVPLPDGRRIPVAMQQGSGTNITMHVNISAPRGRVEPESIRELSARVYEASARAYRRNR